MASLNVGTSSGSEYQVFLSFRGPDTRVGFTDFLFHSLTTNGIHVFRDNEELRVGERIDGSLLRAIDNSKIYIPVFSRTYASSQWCLRELVQIVANAIKSEGNKEILPIFFDVDPDDVKLKTPLYRDAILTLEREKELSNEQVSAWRKALMEVDAIKGWEVKKYGGHGELIKLIVEEVVKKLKTKHRPVTEHLVGIEDQVAQLIKLLDVNSDDVRLIKIYGMGGIGKTTLAKVVFNRLSSCFGKCCCFLEDVRGKSLKSNGLVDLQKKLLSEIGHLEVIRSIDEIEYGMMRIGDVLCNKKVLIVLDDIDKNEQVEKLVGKSALYSGSRILITTRNKNILQINRIKYHILDYEMEMMSIDHALELFSSHAFDRSSPLDDYNDLSRTIVSATGRLPLALEVIGSFLYHKSQELWKETLDKLRKAPHSDVFRKLKISYDALSFEQQQIFLDIACFFVGEDKTNAYYMWKDCAYFPDTGVHVLISMSLVKIVESNKFWMHDQLRDLGREIVHLENRRNPKKRSRIWIREEVLGAIKTKKISEYVQALYLDESICNSRDVVVQSKEIERFEHLRFLKLSQLSLVGDIDLTKLRWISLVEIYKWTNIRLENVVVLELSMVEFLDDLRLQSLIKMTRKLKVLSLQDCHSITRTPDFFECPNLERLTFQRCSKLTNIDGSIEELVNLQCFFVEATKVNKLPDSIWKLKSLREVHLLDESGQSYYWPIYHDSIRLLEDLRVLQIGNSNLKDLLPLGVGGLRFLRILNPSYTLVREVQETNSMLPQLQRIELMQCHEIQELPTFPTSLTYLSVLSSSLRVVPDLSNLTNLVELNLCELGREGDELCIGQLGWIGRLSKLTKLRVRLRQVPIPIELASLRRLNKLDLLELDMQTFQDLKNLSVQRLSVVHIYSVTSPSQDLRNLSSLMLGGSPMQELQLDGLQLPQLKELRVECEELLRLRLSRMSELKEVRVHSSRKLVEIQLSWVFKSLENLYIGDCCSLERLVYETDDVLSSPEGRLIFPSRVLSKFRRLYLYDCHKIHDIQVVGTSESWEFLRFWECSGLQSLRGLSNLKNLKFLDIQKCDSLRIVEGVDELESLGRLLLCRCASLERLIDVSTTKLPNDCSLRITGCKKLRGFKNEFYASIGTLKHSKRWCDPYTRNITKKRKKNVDLVNEGSNGGRSLKRSRQLAQLRNRKGNGERKERRKERRRVLLARARGIRLSRINLTK